MQSTTEAARKARSNCEDICLIARFLDGSESAFEELFRKHQAQLFSVSLRFLGNRTEAEDAVQEAFLDIYQGLSRFKGQSSFLTWAYSITVRRCMTRMRKAARHGELSQALYESPGKHSPDIDRILVQEAVDKLSDNHRIVLILKYYEQLSMQEIAEILGYGVAQVKMRLHRARNALRNLLSQTIGDETS